MYKYKQGIAFISFPSFKNHRDRSRMMVDMNDSCRM